MITYRKNPYVENRALNTLFDASWTGHVWRDFAPVFRHSLCYWCAMDGEFLIGYINIAWDGAYHAFLLEPTVHPDYRRKGIGTSMVRHAKNSCMDAGIVWLHADYESMWSDFYQKCGFRKAEAGVLEIGRKESKDGA